MLFSKPILPVFTALSVLTCSLGLAAPGGSASDIAILQQLVLRERRPTVQELEDAFGGKLPVDATTNSSPTMTSATDIKNRLPKLIAAMEQSFPGATWVFLGRDVFDLGDFVDVFYRSIGQKGRVVRFDASKESFKSPVNYDANHKEIVAYMRGIGIDFSTIDKSEHPFIVVDVASWRDMSQLRQVMRAGYRAYSDLGNDPKELIRKFNVIAVGMSFYREFLEDTDFEPQGFLDHEKPKVTRDGMPDDPIYIEGQRAFAYPSLHWHPVFDRYQLKGDIATTEPRWNSSKGPARAAEIRSSQWVSQRKGLLLNLLKHAPEIQSAGFLERVKAAALEFGYEFPTERTTKLSLKPTRVFKHKEAPTYSSSSWGSWGGSSSGSSSGFRTREDEPDLWLPKNKEVGETMHSQLRTYWDRITDSKDRKINSRFAVSFLEDILGMAKSGTYKREEILYAVKEYLLPEFVASDAETIRGLNRLLETNTLLQSLWRPEAFEKFAFESQTAQCKRNYRALTLALKNAGFATAYPDPYLITDIPLRAAVDIAVDRINETSVEAGNKEVFEIFKILVRTLKTSEIPQSELIHAGDQLTRQIYGSAGLSRTEWMAKIANEIKGTKPLVTAMLTASPDETASKELTELRQALLKLSPRNKVIEAPVDTTRRYFPSHRSLGQSAKLASDQIWDESVPAGNRMLKKALAELVRAIEDGQGTAEEAEEALETLIDTLIADGMSIQKQAASLLDDAIIASDRFGGIVEGMAYYRGKSLESFADALMEARKCRTALAPAKKAPKAKASPKKKTIK